MVDKKKERILIIEDDTVNAIGALQAFSKREDVEINCAGTYKKALEMLDTYKPTIVLSDATIPENSGESAYDFREKISKECEKRKIPYIFVTGAPKPMTHGYHPPKIHIIKKEEDNYKILKIIDGGEKDKEVWEEAYKMLKNKEK